MKPINFKSIKTLNDLKDPKYGITFEQLLEILSAVNIDNNEPIDNKLYGNNYHEEYNYLQHKILAQKEGFNEVEGVNALVYDDKHDFLKDL
jgi:hypothetical protein